ncbi:MAG: DNA polymerase IV [Clostridia bacterium]|nr:DNA polymerase IV [Clostridia bacterium]
MGDRVILHCDCNSFFASVETALNPAYRGVPMAVCGSQDNRHGIVLAKNELAKAYGIKTADTVYSAKRACPSLVIAKPHYDKYVEYSRRVNAIYREYTDLVEPFGIDESWLDVTASTRLFGSGVEIAERIRERVRNEVGITVSVGVSFNKVFAKLGSDYKKPDAVTVLSRDCFMEKIYPLPVGDLLFVGKKTIEILSRFGIKTIGDLANAPDRLLINKLGKLGEMLIRYSRGEDDSPVMQEPEDAKSVGNGFTFKHDLVSMDEIISGVLFLSEEIGSRLRRKGMLATTVSVALKDEYLKVRQKQMPLKIASDIGKEIAETAISLIESMRSESSSPIRMITVTAHNLISRTRDSEQIDMFSDQRDDIAREKLRRGEEAVDLIRRKYGRGSIVRCASIDNEIGVYDPKTSEE